MFGFEKVTSDCFSFWNTLFVALVVLDVIPVL